MIYYVYEHWRLDEDVCFYVGKGKKKRAYSRNNRNDDWWKVVNYLEENGFAYEVRIVISGISETDSLNIERSRISFWRSYGIILTNGTAGGQGSSGLVHSEETKQKIRLKKIGVPSPLKGKKTGKPAWNKGKTGPSGENHPMFGKTHSKHSLELMSIKKKGKSPPNKGKPSPLKGKSGHPQTAETRAKQSQTRKSKNIPAWNKGISGPKGAEANASKPVYEINEDKFFATITEAAKFYGLSISGISSVCNGHQKTTGGHRFVFFKEAENV